MTLFALDNETIDFLKKAVEDGKNPKFKVKTDEGWMVFKYDGIEVHPSK